MPDDTRPDPDQLIAAAAAAARGRLKIFLGAAPGVGKTWEMLVQARRRLAEGVDVVGGIIETHGRVQTIAQLEGLPMLELREVAYRGQALREFDLDAALARRAAVLLVDELAHTNVPGSRHAKRWEDVAELIAAGLNVWATLNVQHLESLNDDVARITRVRVSETLPDRVLQMADEIELIDVPPQELRERLREGKIYQPETARRALDGFFREGNLTSLREIALRRAAAHVDGAVRNWLKRTGVAGPWPSAERVLALVGPDPASAAVVRQAKRLADALAAPWTVLHVERSSSLLATQPVLALAAQLGAEIDTRVGTDLVAATLEAAQQANATHIVLGRAQTRGWRRLFGRTLAAELLRRAPQFAVHVIPLPDSSRRAKLLRRRGREPWWAWAVAFALVVAVTLVGQVLPETAIGMLYLAAIVVGSVLAGLRVALVMAAASFLAWDYFFIPPLYTITIGTPSDLIALLVFALVAILCGTLAGRVREEAQAAQTRIEGLRRIGAFSRRLSAATTEPALLAEVAEQAASIAGEAVVLAGAGEVLEQRAAAPADTGLETSLDAGAWAAARWSSLHNEPAGQGTTTLPGASWRFLPLRAGNMELGVLGLRSGTRLDESRLQTLATLADQAAVAWDRMKLAREGARATALEETQRLRTALLASLGHDLRTPLTGIRGAAGTLRTLWDKLDAATRADLLDSIEQDVARMARFLSNITDLTRLESGQISPRLTRMSLTEAVQAAIAHLPGALIALNLPEPAVWIEADAALLEQALVNVLENAVKYSPSGSIVGVRASVDHTVVALAVADEGVGIPADDLPHVFDSFYRATRGDRVAPGTGLGLAIARGMLEAIGGSIAAQSPRLDRSPDGFPGTVVTLLLRRAETEKAVV